MTLLVGWSVPAFKDFRPCRSEHHRPPTPLRCRRASTRTEVARSAGESLYHVSTLTSPPALSIDDLNHDLGMIAA